MNNFSDTQPGVRLGRTKRARRVIWRARWILVCNWLGRPTNDHVLDWAHHIIESNR